MIMIDDLDRMSPEEVIIVTRMVENFRKVPSIIFVLPFRRQIVASSVGKFLNLNNADSHVYLRKFIKSSITINLTLNNLQESFIQIFRRETPNIREKLLGLDAALVAWYMLLHTILLEELTIIMQTPEDTNASVSLEDLLQNKSHYLPKLLAYFHPEKKENRNHAMQEQGKWQRVQDKYKWLQQIVTNQSSSINDIAKQVNWRKYRQLSLLTNGNEINKPICTQVKYDSQLDGYACGCDQPAEHKTFFNAVIMPKIQSSQRESLLTDEYSRRDIEQLASAIHRDLAFSADNDTSELEYAKQLSNVVKNRFSEFR